MSKVKCLNYAEGRQWAMYHGDCVEVLRQMPPCAVDLALYSPPFANVYTYSDSPRDMGNVEDEAAFIESYRHMIRELYRIMRPGRVAAVHCKQVIRYIGSHGRAGWYDFRGDLIRVHEEEGWQYASEFVLWTDPVIEQRKTNNMRLLYKQLRKDSTFSGAGMPEYLLIFRKWAESDDEEQVKPVSHTRQTFPLEQWQKWASPVWGTFPVNHEDLPVHQQDWLLPIWRDVNHTDTMNVRAAREDGDEKHMCPLSLDTIRRALTLYSNPGDVVLSPFGGVGSEGVGSLRLDRKYVGVELKESYWRRACLNLKAEEGAEQVGLFG